ncbi:hypothetical protein GX51_00787 [Blastomyces parvus]|uniref:Peptidase S33 tripeptidyl aminopeptidase-like C-terminal domain-containing protein n=1 Tax=Blastomyces parvus TaxID=2060905 RepID=A0A2B7XCF4_9EURO|nr:hypothetical protein GX51_00787 [Blastomyces parvus]
MISKSIAVRLAMLAVAVTTRAASTKPSTERILSYYPCENSTLSPLLLEKLREPMEALNMKCGNVTVPLDYTAPESDDTIELELVSVPAAKQPARGTIMFNFGGPGATARDGLIALAGTLLVVTGGEYNLLAFDPRATGTTIPVSCYENDLDTLEFLRTATTAGYSSDTALGKIWAGAKIHADACLKNANDTLPYISTAFVARDLMSVVDALDEDGMLRFWGVSYGTTLGITAAAMFPDKIDKMVLDGVQNPHHYYHDITEFDQWTNSDRAFSEIFKTCLENPDQCPLAHRNKNPRHLEKTIWKLIDALKYRPITIGGILFDHSGIKNMIAGALYDTGRWQSLTANLELLLTGKAHTDPSKFGSDALTTVLGAPVSTALTGIRCVDKAYRTHSYDEFEAASEELHSISRVYGDLTSPLVADCARWKVEPKERYEGDFNVRTKNPVLLTGNRGDAHTPLISAYNVSATFKGSVVLEVDGFGHGSMALPSKCTMKNMVAYWTKGKLPAHGTVCEVESRPFSNITWADVFKGLES